MLENRLYIYTALIMSGFLDPNDSSRSQTELFLLPTGSTKMSFLLMFVTVLHLVTLAILFIATMEKVSQKCNKDTLRPHGEG